MPFLPPNQQCQSTEGKEAVHIRKQQQQTTRTTDFLPRHISIVARTGRRTEQASSDVGLQQRPKRQGKNVWLC